MEYDCEQGSLVSTRKVIIMVGIWKYSMENSDLIFMDVLIMENKGVDEFLCSVFIIRDDGC